jgi:hypothetical protein
MGYWQDGWCSIPGKGKVPSVLPADPVFYKMDIAEFFPRGKVGGA